MAVRVRFPPGARGTADSRGSAFLLGTNIVLNLSYKYQLQFFIGASLRRNPFIF